MNIVVNMKDLIRFTPTSHQDYDMLQKTLRLGQDFLENFKNPGKQDTVRTFSLYTFDTSIYYFCFLWLAVLCFFIMTIAMCVLVGESSLLCQTVSNCRENKRRAQTASSGVV